MIYFLNTHSDAVIALSSAIIGAILGCFGSYWIWWLERRRQRHIARMQIVINLRRWMTHTRNQMYDIQEWVESDGMGGSALCVLSRFRFEKSLETVALIEYKMAIRIFKMIHKKDEANAEVSGISDHVGGEEALDMFRRRLAQIWLIALGIFDQISVQVGWSERAFSDKDKAMMKEEIDRFEKIEQEEVKANAELFP
jgi:hypothetical protein